MLAESTSLFWSLPSLSVTVVQLALQSNASETPLFDGRSIHHCIRVGDIAALWIRDLSIWMILNVKHMTLKCISTWERQTSRELNGLAAERGCFKSSRGAQGSTAGVGAGQGWQCCTCGGPQGSLASPGGALGSSRPGAAHQANIAVGDLFISACQLSIPVPLRSPRARAVWQAIIIRTTWVANIQDCTASPDSCCLVYTLHCG